MKSRDGASACRAGLERAPEPTAATAAPAALRKIVLPGGRALTATTVFETYWRFACKRQDAFMRRVQGESPPWSNDLVISAHRFTNTYRASDRVSQYLIRHVQYGDRDRSRADIIFRTLIFKLFNRIETWERLVDELGDIRWKGFDFARAERVLDRVRTRGETVYSAAYIMPSPAFGEVRKHANHLRLIEHMMRDDVASKVAESPTLEALFKLLRGYPSLGDFLAFQLAIDLNYSVATDFSEMDFVVAGPGARDGMKKCFADVAGLDEADVIRAVADIADAEFDRLGLRFQTLWGRRLQLIDCQNIFCEVDKYSRVVHPEFSGESGRTRIKQRFVAKPCPIPQWYPPKWGIRTPGGATAERANWVAQRSLF